MDWYRAMVKWIWWIGVENTHPFSHGEMLRLWNGLNRAMVKLIWWNGAQNTHPCSHGEMARWWNGAVQIIKGCNGETIILTFNSRQFLGPIQQWGPISLLCFADLCITRWGKINLWMMTYWFYTRPMSRCNALWCCIPLILSNFFLLLILLFSLLPPPTSGWFIPFCTLLILIISWCSCNGNISSCQ